MGDRKFRAFISYSHADEEWGAWLQRSLERFRTPKDLARLISAQGRPVRLSPVFRDREDLPVAGNLNEAIRQALADSEFQIVLCSPNAAKSRWVNEEIKLFNRLHGPGRTFAIIIAGEPGGGDRECFPPALRFKLDADGEPTPEPAEPLAADAREEGDGKRYALLKTAAGMLGVGLDDLVRREARERARKTRAAVGVISTIAASMTFAAVFAFNQKNEAQRARGEAEDLIEFMLSDLKDRLDPVGRLDILEEVGGKVLAYYDNQDLKSLDADALSRRARGLMQLGNVDQRRGDDAAAQKAYDAAFASTEENLRRTPNNPDRIFDHAQSVFYRADLARSRGDKAATESGFLEYFRLAEKLVALAPGDKRSQTELAYAYSNLGAAKFHSRRYAESLSDFQRSVDLRRALVEKHPEDRNLAFDYGYALSWLAYAELFTGRNARAVENYSRQLEVYERLLAEGEDYKIYDAQVSAQRRLSSALLNLGRTQAARRAIDAARSSADKLVRRDPDNLNSIVNAAYIARAQSYLAALTGDHAAEITFAEEAIALARDYQQKATGDAFAQTPLAYANARRLSAAPADQDVVDAVVAALRRELDAGANADLDLIAYAALAILQDARRARRDVAETIDLAPAIALLDGDIDRLVDPHKIMLATIHLERNETEKAREIVQRFEGTDFAHPELVALRAALGEKIAAENSGR